MPENKVALKLNGREIEPRLPAFLQPSARGTAQADDVFLPAGYLRATKTFDASPTARGAADAAADLSHKAGADEVVVLELADRGIYITNAAQLRATLKLTHPELIGPHGEILLEELRATAAAPRGFLSDTIGGLVSKVYTFVVGESQDAIIKDAAGSAGSLSELGVTWAGTKALMWAIENRLDQKPGLYRWVGSAGTPADLETEDLSARAKSDADAKPILVFIHGTGSSSGGSFGDVRSDADLWASLERKYTGGIFAFEHRTLSQGPIENAIDL